jgi:hypothetical protein
VFGSSAFTLREKPTPFAPPQGGTPNRGPRNQTRCGKRNALVIARISGLEKKQAPWHLRWFYGVMRKMFGKDLTPARIQMRLPGLMWGGIAVEAAIGRKRLVSLRYIQLGRIRAAARVGCPF